MTGRGAYGIQAVPAHTPGALMCGTCGRAWMEDITPAGRCPWEGEHAQWVTIVYLDGDEGRCVVDGLYDVCGVVARGATSETVADTAAYLTQWDDGEDYDVSERAPWGAYDDTWTLDGYTLSANLGLGYVALQRRGVSE